MWKVTVLSDTACTDNMTILCVKYMTFFFFFLVHSFVFRPDGHIWLPRIGIQLHFQFLCYE